MTMNILIVLVFNKFKCFPLICVVFKFNLMLYFFCLLVTNLFWLVILVLSFLDI